MRKLVNIQDVFNPIRFADGVETLHWGALVKRLDLPPGDPSSINLSPDYQRDYVWTDEQASLFVGHMLSGGVTGYIIVQRHPVARSGPTIPDEVIERAELFKNERILMTHFSLRHSHREIRETLERRTKGTALEGRCFPLIPEEGA